mmetsp:Transcript_4159/g.7066  ORF Transcript_4159/g.7066 Transcript_4159/m.7066 type:complete len:274 (+) Transcript_4159:909-1730(+)
MLVVSHQTFHHSLGERVERPYEVWLVLLREPNPASHRVVLVVLKDAPGGKVGHVDAACLAGIAQRENTCNVCAHRLHLMGLAPVHIWPACHTRRVQDVRGLQVIQLILYLLPFLQATAGILPVSSLCLQQLAQDAANPSRAPEHQVSRLPSGGNRWQANHFRLHLNDRRDSDPLGSVNNRFAAVSGILLEDILDVGLLDVHELRKLLLQLARVHLVVRPRSRQNLRLLLQREVLPGVQRVHVLLVQRQHLVVADHARVREVVHPSQPSLGHLN